MVPRATRCTRINTLKAKPAKIQSLNKHVDYPDWIVLSYIVFQSFGK